MNNNSIIWKSIFGSILMLFVFYSCGKCKNTEGGLLWEITGNGLKAPSYLFGTHHEISGDFLDSINGFYEAFNSVKQVAVEFDNTKPKKLDSIKPLKLYLPTDTTYRDLLDDRELAVLDSVLMVYFNVKSERVSINPNILAINLQSRMIKKESQKWAETNPFLFDANHKNSDLDSKLFGLINNNSYPVIELDTEEMLDSLGIRDMSILFSSDNLKARAKELVYSIIEFIADTSLINMEREIKKAYYEQDLALIEKWSTHPKILKDDKAKSIYNTLKIKRNILWMDKILSAIEKQPTFIMVGAAHLPGREGIINLLREEGYIVKPVK